jgi:hypothetical protein
MSRITVIVLSMSLGLASGVAVGVQELRAASAPLEDGPQYVCLHHPANPEECAPTWMHTCWCTVKAT